MTMTIDETTARAMAGFLGFFGPAAPSGLTIPQVAARLQISKAKTRMLLVVGDLQGFRVGRVWRVEPKAIDAYILEVQHRARTPRPTARPGRPPARHYQAPEEMPDDFVIPIKPFLRGKNRLKLLPEKLSQSDQALAAGGALG